MKKEIFTHAIAAIGILATCADAQQAIDPSSLASSGATTVNELAANPSAYLGQVCGNWRRGCGEGRSRFYYC